MGSVIIIIHKFGIILPSKIALANPQIYLAILILLTSTGSSS